MIRTIRAHRPRVEILVRADSHYAAPEVFNLCRARGVDFIPGLATNAARRAHVIPLEASTRARATGSDKVRRFTAFHDGARSWCRVERIIARVEAGPQGVDTRFIPGSSPRTTSLTGGRGKWLYEQVYCRWGMAEEHTKSRKTHLVLQLRLL
ncbi:MULTISPECIES: transposase [unclassified Azospirillum]|uniref:transposase n=1 Tax=unclassified Azospirillum TaxID=2630922 RepID=UPI000B66630C|nr:MULTISPECIES: transposase [unclassified Azospirillum]SNS75242.1 Transposase DDE domain group 1 [Azospirillum sp. RU38E]SNS92399.1 Transposase DDE domain group 1 [Azospirillum sp. RU37A]